MTSYTYIYLEQKGYHCRFCYYPDVLIRDYQGQPGYWRVHEVVIQDNGYETVALWRPKNGKIELTNYKA